MSRNGLFIWKYQLRLEQFLDTLWFTVGGQRDSRSRVQSHAGFLHAGSLSFDRQKKTCSPRLQVAKTLFSIIQFMRSTWRRLLRSTPLFSFRISSRDFRCQRLPPYLYIFIYGLRPRTPVQHLSKNLFFLTHVENVRSQYSLIKLVKMSGNDTIIQYFRGNKQHLHDFGLINQVKWWDVIKNMPLIPGVWS